MHIFLSNKVYKPRVWSSIPGEFALDTIAIMTAVSSLRRTNIAGVVG